jgi:DNA-binding transcriptional LysR family regulator
MRRDELGDMLAFLAVAEERSFTRAAAKTGTSQSSLSHTVRRLEERMGVRLLVRTTRSVSPTPAGEALVATLQPAFRSIDVQVESLSELRTKPAGIIRLTAVRHAAEAVVLPKLRGLLKDYPDIQIELSIDQRLTDIAAEQFDGGIRLGERLEKDMIAVKIGPDLRLAVVGSPEYFERHPVPLTPYELTKHVCINLRLPTQGGMYIWEFEKDGHELNVRVEGQFICNDPQTNIRAAMEGLGLICLPEDHVEEGIRADLLVRVLEDWCPPFAGYYLYYPSRRQLSPAFRLLIDALRR